MAAGGRERIGRSEGLAKFPFVIELVIPLLERGIPVITAVFVE